MTYKNFNSQTLMQQLTNNCNFYFKKCAECGEKCNHPKGKCSGSCADCLKEIQYHRSDGRNEYNCKNMLRYYTCHTIWKRCSEIMYALEALELNKYSKFNILSIGCGTAPDLMAFNNIIKNKKISFLGIDISPTWYDIHNKIKRLSHNSNVNFQTKDIYKTLENEDLSGKFNVIILQYMIAGHIYSDRAEKLDFLFDKLIEKLIIKKPEKTPLMFIINDIDHKSWICDYFNLFIKKLRKAGLNFEYYKRHFESREENDGSKQYKERTNKFTAIISKEQKEKYNADAPCSAAQLIIEVK